MTIRKVLRAGNPLVRQRARPLSTDELDRPAVEELIEDMLETMRDENGVGLAAPQVQVSMRVIVYGIKPNERYPQIEEAVGPRVMINPTIEKCSPELNVDWEGCLSLPDLRGKVPRHDWIEVTYFDTNGEEQSIRVDGFEARVIQHEIDHLEGTLFADRMRSTESLSFGREYRRYHVGTQTD